MRRVTIVNLSMENHGRNRHNNEGILEICFNTGRQGSYDNHRTPLGKMKDEVEKGEIVKSTGNINKDI